MENAQDTPNQGAKVPFDPGWNDPPPLKNSSQLNTPSKPRNFLNKRVAFPLSGGTNSATPPINLPPMPTGMPPLLPPPVQIPPKNLTNEEFSIDSETTLKEVKQILLEFLEQSSELGPKATDIKRRIDAMDGMWRNGKLNNAVQIQMKELACALRDDQPSKADDIHRGLMISHVGAVGTWMPGVKQLVHHCIARSELLNIDNDT